jgi:hypothetical protein
MARPELFAQLRDPTKQRMSRPALAELLIRYHERLLASGVPGSRALARVKQWLRMGADMDPTLEPLFTGLKTQPAWEPARAQLRSWAQ